MDVVLQPMAAADIPYILSIENIVNPSPCKEGMLKRLLEKEQMAFVLKDVTQEQLVGYVCFSSVCDEAELLIIGIDPSFQKKGFGMGLLNSALEEVKLSGVLSVFLEVRGSNLPAIALYERSGFVKTGRRKGYYPSAIAGADREDALLFQLTFPGSK
ncbi:MAG: ribosomal protein S18-alanine N-acetyltransferase [Cellvibrionaceae bacterium]